MASIISLAPCIPDCAYEPCICPQSPVQRLAKTQCTCHVCEHGVFMIDLLRKFWTHVWVQELHACLLAALCTETGDHPLFGQSHIVTPQLRHGSTQALWMVAIDATFVASFESSTKSRPQNQSASVTKSWFQFFATQQDFDIKNTCSMLINGTR
jgi:hypothetical protein